MSDFYRRALIGALITLAAAPLPLVGIVSPVLGGWIAAWLDVEADHEGSRIGALTGLIAAAVLLPVTVVVSLALTGVGEGTLAAVPPFVFLGVVYLTTLGAVGGFAGERLLGGATGDRAGEVSAEENEAVRRLQRRYVDGSMTEREFERRLERLLESDGGPSVADETDETQADTREVAVECS